MTDDQELAENEEQQEGTDEQQGQQEQDQQSEGEQSKGKAEDLSQEEKKRADTIAHGADEKGEEEQKPYWPEDWAAKAAEHVAAGDQKALERETKRLERIANPAALYGMYRELEAKLTSGNLTRIPGKDAKPEEIAEFRQQLGMPEKVEGYFDDLQLENGVTIGDDDKPVIDSFAGVMHEAGLTKDQMTTALNWYFSNQETEAAELDESDEKFKNESLAALKEEMGPSFKRQVNSIGSVFKIAPGGADAENPESLFSRIMFGRTSDGKVIGDDPDVTRFFAALAQEINPAAAVFEDGLEDVKGIDTEIEELEKKMHDRVAWSRDEKSQARYRQLIETRNKIQARQQAA
jgi:hypothetical protein